MAIQTDSLSLSDIPMYYFNYICHFCILQVCNKFDICSEYNDTAVVTEKTSFSEEEKEEFKSDQVDQPKYARMLYDNCYCWLSAKINCDMIKGNESLVENFNFYFLTHAFS